MKRLLTLARHAQAHVRVYCLTIRLADAINASDDYSSDNERIANNIARRTIGRELVHAQMRLDEFSPHGDRKTWEIA